MDQQQIKTFIDAMAASDLDEMEFAQNGWTLRLVRHVPRHAVLPTASEPRVTLASMPRESLATPPLVAPLYGVVHLSPAPDEPPFVAPGQTVSVGQTLCVIEAMKVFNEVRAERAATLDDFTPAPRWRRIVSSTIRL